MIEKDLITRYNYDAFTPDKFNPWMRWEESPSVGETGPDFTLWDLDENPITLHEIFKSSTFTIVEFGSFT